MSKDWVIVTDRSSGRNHHFRYLQWSANDVRKAEKDLISYRKVNNVYLVLLNDFILISYGLFRYLTFTNTVENETSLQNKT